MTDTSTRTAGPEVVNPNRLSQLMNDVSNTPIGTPMRKGTVAEGLLNGEAIPAEANSTTDTVCIGLLATAGPKSGHGILIYAGPIELTTAEWDALTGDTGGLVPNDRYYLSQGTAGKITKTRPVTGIRAPIGVALSDTVLLVQITDAATVGA